MNVIMIAKKMIDVITRDHQDVVINAPYLDRVDQLSVIDAKSPSIENVIVNAKSPSVENVIVNAKSPSVENVIAAKNPSAENVENIENVENVMNQKKIDREIVIEARVPTKTADNVENVINLEKIDREIVF